jgi:hypothetical protein
VRAATSGDRVGRKCVPAGALQRGGRTAETLVSSGRFPRVVGM